jgi:hypothetical protein
MALWNFQDERRLFDSNFPTRLATQMIALVFWTASAHKTCEPSTSLTCITTLVLSCKLWTTMAILGNEAYWTKRIKKLENRTHIAKACIRSSGSTQCLGAC